MAPPLGAEVATHWLESGRGHARRKALRSAMKVRHAIAAQALDGLDFVTRPGAQHVWLRLPEVVGSARAFAGELEREGVRVSPADAFEVHRGIAPRAVRLSISAPPTRSALAGALARVAGRLRAGAGAVRATL